MTLLAGILVLLASWGGTGPTAPAAPPGATVAAGTLGGVLGAGARLSWESNPRQDLSTRMDLHMVARPVPRLFGTAAWGRSELARGGGGFPESTVVSTRWEIGAAVVVVQGEGSGYLPVVWRRTSEKDDRRGDTRWSSWGLGAGALFPVRHPVWVRAEGLWMMDDRHEDPVRGVDRALERSGLELGLGFLVFLF
ncbi:MAG: hypothetical protein H6686_05005 [Fibrobacteria bacterium]|nr:hypothetical protein [Fibrobacteria bacterium]